MSFAEGTINRRGRIRFTPEQEKSIVAALASGRTVTSVAEEMGYDWRSVRKRQKAMLSAAANGVAPKSPAPIAHLPSLAHEREITRLRDEVRLLKKRNGDLHRQAINDDAIREILTGMARHEVQPAPWLNFSENLNAPEASAKRQATPEVLVTCWSDWHLGERVSAEETHGINAYDLTIAQARVARVVESTIAVARDHGPKHYPGAVVALLGDFVSGGLHPELLATDEMEVIPSALKAVDILSAALRRMADVFGRLYVPCVCGNHGRLTQKPQFKRYVYKNADFLIYEMLRAKFADDPRVIIDHRSEDDVHFKVYGLRFAATHGDMLGVKGGDGIIGALGPIARGEVKTGKQMSSIGRDYDILLMGHWHQQLWLPRAIVANSLKGWDEYARKSLRAPPSPPSQPMFFVHPRRGITSRWEIMADAGDAPKVEPEWVSWQKG